MIKYLSLAVGGAIGTVIRAFVSASTQNFFPSSVFPWGTLAVNLSGSFIIGVLAGLYEADFFSAGMRTFLFIGLIGGFTTFSAFSLETVNLIRSGELRYAFINVAASNFLGIALAFGGVYLSRSFIGLLK